MKKLLAQAGDWGIYQLPVTLLIGASVAFLGILRWRDADVKRITGELKKEWQDKTNERDAEWRKQTDALEARVKAMEAKMAHLENGSILATMRAVEIKATSLETRTQDLAQAIIDALALKPEHIGV